MEFVYMTRPGVEGGARFPATAVPHWEGYGWQVTDPPPRPPRPGQAVKRPTVQPAPPAVRPEPTADQNLDVADTPTADTPKTTKPSTRRKED